MILRTEVCNDESLQSLLSFEPSSIEYQTVMKHVDQCQFCQSRLEQLAAEGEFWDEAQSVLTGDPNFATGDVRKRSPWHGRTIAWNESMASRLLSAPSHPEMLGRIGRYDVERLLGSGGMGLVFKAFDSELNRPVAVKLLAPYLSGNGSARKRFSREARAAAAVVDEHVVAIHNVESDDDPENAPFLVMKYIAGGSLQQRIDREGPLEVCEVLRIGMQVAKGLAAAHGQGLIHRDIKPSNILLEEGVDRALLTDFGLARTEDDACLTRSGFQPGTPHYMSPEQVRGDSIDGRSDLFGLGCSLYSMCTGHPPFRAESSYAVLRRITDDQARSIREINPDVPEWLERIVMKLLAKAPDDRFESAEAVAILLEDCLAHRQQPLTTPLPTSIPRRVSRRRQPPWVKYLVAWMFAFLLFAACVVIVLELNKGTLRIESDLEEVPVSIMLGDQVVKQLTVTKSGELVRVAAGKYEVKIGGKFDEVHVDGGNVTLGRGGSETIRITQSTNEEPKTISSLGNEQLMGLVGEALELDSEDRSPLDVEGQAQHRGFIRWAVAPFSGVFEKLLVKDGDNVNEGQVLAKLSLPEIEKELRDCKRDIEKATLRYQQLMSEEKIAAATLLRQEIDQKKKRLEIVSRQKGIESFQVRSPVYGKVRYGTGVETGMAFQEGQVLFEIDCRVTPEQAFEKIEKEHQRVSEAYRKACDAAKDSVELNRVYDEMDPREIMPAQYLAFEEQNRGTPLGLQALIKVSSMAQSIGDPGSESAIGRAKGLGLIAEHYMYHEGLEQFVRTIEGGPSPEETDVFLRKLANESPFPQVRADALLAQIKREKYWLRAENQVEAICEKIKLRIEKSPPEMKAEGQRQMERLQNMDFVQLRKDLNAKLDQLSGRYFDVEVEGYKTAGAAAARLKYAINKVIVGKPAPELQSVDLDGKPFRLSELRGKHVVLLFAHCSKSSFNENYSPIRQLTARYQQAPVKVVGIINGMKKEDLRAAKERGEINWTVLPQEDSRELLQNWGIRGYPWAYIVDADGTLHPLVHLPNWGAGGFDTSDISKKLDELVGRAE